jgi:hypothetical protein
VTLRDLAIHERELGTHLDADETGAWLHARRGKHAAEVRCDFCAQDGRELRDRLRNRRPLDDEAGVSGGSSPRLADTPASSSSGSRTPGAGRARSTDPPTSHAAAASARQTTATKQAILALFDEFGPMDDVTLVDRYLERLDAHAAPPAQPSGIRTRRCELVEDGLLLDTGRRVTLQSTGRKAIVWALVNQPRREYDPEPAL